MARPRVALLSIGEEKGKGDQRITRATELLDATSGLNFIGNVEGKDLTRAWPMSSCATPCWATS